MHGDEFDRFRGQGHVERWRWDKPVLVVVDYAASRAEQIRAWVRELVDASFETRPKLRLLLLERQANRAIGWLSTVFGLGDDERFARRNRAARSERADRSPGARRARLPAQSLCGSAPKANPALDAPALGVDPEFDRRLADHKWAGDPLYLMMAGLVAAREGVQAALGLSRADLALSTGRNELDRIGRIGAARGVDEKQAYPGAFVRHMAVLATLAQGLTLPEARDWPPGSATVLVGGPARRGDPGARDALPAAAGARRHPSDIVGEGAILAWLGAEGGWPRRALTRKPASRMRLGSRSESERNLMRAAQDFAAAGYAEPIRWLEGLAGAPEADLGALIEIADALPVRRSLLRETAAELTDRIVGC